MKNKITIRIFNIMLACLIVFGGLFYFPVKIKALNTDIKINEIIYVPSDSIEWVELFNAGPDDVDLLDWIITDEDGGYEYLFSNSVIFPAGCYLIIRSDNGNNDLDFSDNTGVIYAGHGSDYANTLDQVAVYQSSTIVNETTIVDFVAWGGDGGSDDDHASLAGIWNDGEYVSGVSHGHSIGLSFDGEDYNDISDWQEFISPTPGESNENSNEPPSIVKAQTSPESAPADDLTSILLTAEISDPEGLMDIISVKVDLSDIGGSNMQEMFDNGMNGDNIADDGIYCHKTTIPTTIAPGDYQLSITVKDSADNEDIRDISIKVTAPQYSSQIRINEILPNPSGPDVDNEFIELYNEGENLVDLKGWIIRDESGSSYHISSSDFSNTKISPKEYFVIYRNISGVALNNGGDKVQLFHPDDNELDSTTYDENAQDDFSYNYKNNSWHWSVTLTPGSINQINSPNSPPEAEAGEDLQALINKPVYFDGTGSMDPDGDELTCRWDFGDDSNTSGCKTTHAYDNDDIFTAILTVYDNNGGQDSDFIKVTVCREDDASVAYSKDLVINEFLPNPKGSDNKLEFIEIYNLGSEEIDITGWKLDDEEGGSSPYTFAENTKITAKGHLVFYRDATGISINNSGDSVRLLYPDEKEAYAIAYAGSAKDDEAYARDNDNTWKWTTTPTPGEENIISEPALKETEENSASDSSKDSQVNSESSASGEIQKITIKQAKAKNKNTKVKVLGVVTAPPDVLNQSYFYIQDSTAGIQIYFSKKDFPKLKLGDYLEISGQVSERSGEKKINVKEKSDIKLISHQEPPKPAFIKTGSVKENFEGHLVTVTGQITKSSGNTFYIDDGSGEIKIYIQKSTGIKKPEWKKEDWVTITGIVGETSSGYRVMPRFQEDLKTGKHVLEEGDIPAAGIKFKWPSFFAIWQLFEQYIDICPVKIMH